MTDTPPAAAARHRLMQELQVKLSALPRPDDAPRLCAEQVLAYLQGTYGSSAAGAGMSTATADEVHEAVIDAALLSVIESFAAVVRREQGPAAGDGARTPRDAPWI